MKSIYKQLTLASCSLLSQQAFGQAIENDWVIDSSLLHYAEADDRVKVWKLIGSVEGKVSTRNSVKVHLVYDTMTGSTPTGLISDPNAADTGTGPSGQGNFGSGASTTLAPFEDTRLGVNADWTHEYSRTLSGTYGAAISIERDYQSVGASATFAKDSPSRLTTYTAGGAVTLDTISRTGGRTPIPLSNFQADPDDIYVEEGTRHTYDAMVGISRVFNVRTIGQVNLSIGNSAGYHTDPYKLVSIADDASAVAGAIYESRPETRQRRSIYTKLAHQLQSTGDIFHVSYRWYDDDWEVNSHTLEFTYHFKQNWGGFFEPHVRFYQQTAAYFYQHHLDSDVADASDPSSLPDFVSADYRLDEMTSYTLGLKFGMPLFNTGKLRARIEFINQAFSNSEFETNEATVFQLSYQNVFD